MSELLKAVIKPQRKLFYSMDSSFGIYAVEVLESDRMDLIKTNGYGNITIKGNMPELEHNTTYIAELTPKKDPKFGLGYEVSTIYSKPLATVEEIKVFLQSILTSFQATSIIEAYPDENVIELIKNDKFDYSKVKGIGDKIFEKIKNKIIESEKYQKAILVLTGEFQIPYNQVKRMSDKYGSPDLLLQNVKENPYILTELDGYGFKKADEIALKMGIDKKSPHRINSCISYILDEHAGDGHCWSKKSQVVNDAIKLLGVKISDVIDVLKEDNNNNGYVVVGDMVYNFKYLTYESSIAENIFRLLNADVEYSIEGLDEKIKEIEDSQGFPFTEEQLEAIRLSATRNVIIVNGKAGTGKTSTIKGMVGVHKSIHGLEYATCALSGKASQRIQESTGLFSSTMHRLLGYNPLHGFMFDDTNPLPYDIIILDEASMVNSQLFYYLIRAIKSGAKLIITGDTAQLEPIGVGNVLVDLLNSNVVPKVELTIVHRQAQKSGILSCANMVRDGKKFLSSNDYSSQRLGELKDLYVYPYEDKGNVIKKILSIAKKYNGDIFDFQVIVPMKKRGEISTQNINRELQKIFNNDPDDVGENNKYETKDVVFTEGDKVILNGNSYSKGVFNGTIGIITDINKNAIDESGAKTTIITIDFEGIGNIPMDRDDMKRVDLAYAITCHKSQGSQWKYVVFALDYSSYVLLNRQLTYTAMTRASEALFIPMELKALQRSIEIDNSVERRTFLPSFLVEENVKKSIEQPK